MLFIDMQKLIIDTWKIIIKINWDVNNLNEWAMSQKLPVNRFKWGENTSWFSEGFSKNYNEDSDQGYFLEVDVNHPRKLHGLHNNLPLLPIKTMENVRKHSYQACNNWNKKVLFSIWTKLSYNKSFFRKFISHRNENNKYIHE